MPFYEYECQACKYYTEVMQKITDAPLTKCPSCGKRKLKKLVSAPVFRLKGAGWYETDFKGDKDNQRNLADRPEADASKDAKDADAKGKDDKGKDDKGVNGKDAKATEKSSDAAPKESAAKEKADKPAEKRPARSVQKKKKPLKVKRRR